MYPSVLNRMLADLISTLMAKIVVCFSVKQIMHDTTIWTTRAVRQSLPGVDEIPYKIISFGGHTQSNDIILIRITEESDASEALIRVYRSRVEYVVSTCAD